jgi:uncharacterized membrane protein
MDGFAEVILLFTAFGAIVIAFTRVNSAEQRIAALEKRIRLLEAEKSPSMEAASHWEPAVMRSAAREQGGGPVPAASPSTTPVVPQPSMAQKAPASNSHLATDATPLVAPPVTPLSPPVEPWGKPVATADLAQPFKAAQVQSRQPVAASGHVAAKASSRSAPVDSLPASLLRIVAKNPLASAGVLLLLVGVGFLFALLAARNILPPIVRIGLIASGGALLFGTGLRLEKKNSAVAFNLQGGAIAVEFLCGLWAYTGYHLLNATEAFFVLGAISTLAYLWAAFKKGLPFAFIGLIGALATPVVTSTGHGEFSSLVLYCLWIASLTICIAGYLRSASLAPAALLGISVLLGVALGGNHGDAQFIVAGCSTMALAFAAAGLVWARSEPAPTDKLRAAIVILLLFPSLVMASFIAAATSIDLSDSALLAGAVGVLLLVGAWFKSQHWRVWLIMIGSMLTFVAIALHMHGAGQSVVLAAGALGLFMVAHSLKTPVVRVAATLYWIVSSVVALDALSSGHTAPIYAAGVVALLAAHMEGGGVLSIAFLVAAPLLAGAGAMHTFDGSAAHVLVFMLLWTLVAFGAVGVLKWPQCRYSALWLLPAGAALMISPEWTGSSALWALREGVLAAWLVLSTWLVRAVYQATSNAKSSSYLWTTQLIAVCICIEAAQMCGPLGFDHKNSIFAALALVWSMSASLLVRFTASEQRDSVIDGAAALSLIFAMLSVVITPFSAIDELLMVAALVVVVELHRKGRLTSGWLNATLLTSVGLLAAAGAILQFVGAREGLDQMVLMLLFDERMQSSVSILWAAFGLVIVASGSKRAARDVWVVGAVSLAVLVVKMFVVDLASLSLPAKVGTFMLVGVLFIALGYFCPLPASGSRDGGVIPVEP